MKMQRLLFLVACITLWVLFVGSTTGLGAQEFLISSPAGGDPSTNPDIAFGNGQYLAVWERTSSIYGARVLPDGTVLDPGGIKLPEYTDVIPGTDLKPAASFDGTQFMVTYLSSTLDMLCIGSRMRALILAARVAQDGTVLDALADSLGSSCTVDGGVNSPAIGTHGDGCLASWIQGGLLTGSSVRGAIVTPDLGKTPLVIRSPAGIEPLPVRSPAVAYGVGNYLAAWADPRDEVSFNIYVGRVTSDGTVLDPDGYLVSSAGSPDDDLPAVAFGSSTFLVVWERAGAVRGARIHTDGTVLDPDGFAIHDGSHPALTFDGTSFLVVWEEGSPDAAVYGANVTTAGSVSESFQISGEGTTATSPSVTFDGSQALVVWQRSSGGDVDIYGTFVAASSPPAWQAATVEGRRRLHGSARTSNSVTANTLGLLLAPLALAILWGFRLRRQQNPKP